MNQPKVQAFSRPKHIDEFPTGTCFAAGYLAEVNAGWRTETPQLLPDICNGCLQCYLLCPEGVIYQVNDAEPDTASALAAGDKRKKHNVKLAIDYDFCKGCGICARECKAKAIVMQKDGP